jgi:hypothetical protein
MDDAGMSHDSNMGIEQVLEKGGALTERDDAHALGPGNCALH